MAEETPEPVSVNDLLSRLQTNGGERRSTSRRARRLAREAAEADAGNAAAYSDATATSASDSIAESDWQSGDDLYNRGAGRNRYSAGRPSDSYASYATGEGGALAGLAQDATRYATQPTSRRSRYSTGMDSASSYRDNSSSAAQELASSTGNLGTASAASYAGSRTYGRRHRAGLGSSAAAQTAASAEESVIPAAVQNLNPYAVARGGRNAVGAATDARAAAKATGGDVYAVDTSAADVAGREQSTVDTASFEASFGAGPATGTAPSAAPGAARDTAVNAQPDISAEAEEEDFYTAGMDGIDPRFLMSDPEPDTVPAAEYEQVSTSARNTNISSTAANSAGTNSAATNTEATSAEAAEETSPLAAANASLRTVAPRSTNAWQRLRERALGDSSEEEKKSVNWLIQITQVVVTMVLGGLGFWGFGVLWAHPTWAIPTFIAALVVQLILVATARFLRRRDEFWVILFTVAVGFFVTVGPLVFFSP